MQRPNSLTRRLVGLALGLAVTLGVARAQDEVPSDFWLQAGLENEALVEPFDTLAIANERVLNLPAVDSAPPLYNAVEPVVVPVSFEAMRVDALAGQPLDLPPVEQVTPPAPQPPPAEGDSAAESAEAPAQTAPAGGQAASTSSSGQQEQTFGRRPTSNSLQFLRRDSVLIGEGKTQFDYGVNYARFENDVPVATTNGSGDVVNVVEGRVLQRLVYSPFGYRYGITDDLQFNAYLPIGWSGSEFAVLGQTTNQSTGGIGDLTAGFSYLLCDGDGQQPDFIASAAFTAPTGDFNAPLFGFVPGSALGQGFWAINAQGLFVHRYDPIVAFYGAGYRHLFERSISGSPFQPGEQISYQFGLGFAVNDRVTLSATFFGYYITDSEVSSQTIDGTNLEPLSLRFAATVVRNCKIIEPFAAIGMTEDAPSAYIGVIFTRF